MRFYYLVYRDKGIPEGLPEVLKLLFVYLGAPVAKMIRKKIKLLFLPLFNQLRNIIRYRLIAVKLHTKSSSALGQGSQGRGITKHFRQRYA